MDRLVELAFFLRERRKSLGYDIRTLAKKSGVTNTQISRIETGLAMVTMETLVKLSYGLGINLFDIISALPKPIEEPNNTSQTTSFDKLTDFQDRLGNFINPNSIDKPIPLVDDILDIASIFKNDPEIVENILIKGFQESHDKQKPPLFDLQPVLDQIIKIIHGEVKKFSLMQYPESSAPLGMENADGVGVLTMQDFVVSIRLARKNTGLSFDEIDKKVKVDENVEKIQRSHLPYNDKNKIDEKRYSARISRSTIARIEIGYTDRLLFTQVLELDRLYEFKGVLIAIAWEAAKYETGFIKNYIQYGEERTPFQDWDRGQKAIADAFITICRWHYFLGGDQSWWKNTRRLLHESRNNVAKQ